MHIDINLKDIPSVHRGGLPPAFAAMGPESVLPAHKSLRRVLKLLHAVNVRLSVFTFEALPGTMGHQVLFSAVESAVDDSGLAFELEDGRIGALVYGWRPSGANDDWVESRTLARLDWALGGPDAARHLVDVYAIHRASDEIASDGDVRNLLTLADRVSLEPSAGSTRVA